MTDLARNKHSKDQGDELEQLRGRKVQVDGEELKAVSKSVNLGIQRFSCSVLRMGNMAKRDATKLNLFLHKSLRRLMKIL